MTQTTLISLYGEKRPDFAAAIIQCQQCVTQALGSAFTPYDLRQIHATVVGLERRIASPPFNANFAKHRGRDVVMDFAGYFAYLRGCGLLPFEVQIGGFDNRDYPFTSRKTRPYERSFSVQGDKVVLMGWPVRGEPFIAPPATPAAFSLEARTYPATLDIVRHAAQRFGILHGYHRTLTDVDNDLFFRIGLVDPKAVTPAKTSTLESQVRQSLSTQPPLVIEIRLEDISVAAYEDDRLPGASTQIWSLADPRVTGDFVAGLLS
ncbi:MAG: hypothetical protein WCV00_13285 [Verrucomicrobiia bacterium]